MGSFVKSVKKVFFGAGLAFGRYPASIACALGVTGITLVRIALLDTLLVEKFKSDFLFSCLYLALIFGAILSLAAVTVSKTHFKSSKAFILANLIGPLAALVSFAALYKFAGLVPRYGGSDLIVSPLATGRMIVLTVISFIAFIVAASLPSSPGNEKVKDSMSLGFPKAFFMTLKGIFTALIYGSILFAGVSGVAAAFRALLYMDMSEKVFMVMGTLAGFIAFTIFLGYFPDFSKGADDPNRESAERQPRFIEVLLGNILVPIMLALTLVLLAWAGKTIFVGMNVSFVALSGIAAAYTIGGIILHMLVASYETGLAKFYRRVYPLASFAILAFEAWALFNQLKSSGMKLTEYWFILVWLTAALGAVFLLTLKKRAYLVIFSLACALALVAVLPGLGYNVIPIKSQTARLERLLTDENMLLNGELIPAKTEPADEVKAAITDSADYLIFANDAKIPAWLKGLGEDSKKFKENFGFERTRYQGIDLENSEEDYFNINLGTDSSAMDISEYDLALNAQLLSDIKLAQDPNSSRDIKLEGQSGTYSFSLKNDLYSQNDPVFVVSLGEKQILQADLAPFIGGLKEKYAGTEYKYGASLEDMTLKLESPEIKLMLVFDSIGMNVDHKLDKPVYFIQTKIIYVKETVN